MKKNILFCITLCILAAVSIPLTGQDIEYNMQLLSSVMADAGSSISLTEDVEASLYNPAGLSYAHGKTTALMSYSRLWDTSLHYITVNIKIPVTVMAVGISYIDTADQVIPIRSTDPNILGSFHSNSSLVYFNLAYPLTERFFLGLKGKALYQTIYSYSSWGYGMDAGILYKSKNQYQPSPDILASLLNKISVGLFIRNALPLTIKLAEQADTCRTDINLGVSYAVPKTGPLYINPVLNLDFYDKTLEEVSSGIQLNLFKILTLASGYQFNRKKIGAGCSIDFKNIEAGYAVSVFEVENINTIDMKVRF